MINPYLDRSMIREPGKFLGRSEEIHNVYMRIANTTPQSCSIVGLRRIGKSSLLFHLYKKRGNYQEYISGLEDKIISVFYDLQPERNITIVKLLEKLKQKILKASRQAGIDFSYAVEELEIEVSFQNLIEEISENGYKIIIFLDEFESVTLNSNFDEDFFALLRYIANSFNVAFVTSSYSELSQLCHQDVIAQSPFFNIFTTIYLRLLTYEESLQLINRATLMQPTNFSDIEIDKIFNLAGTHPFFLNIACNHLFELKRKNSYSTEELESLFYKEAEPHFLYYINHLNYEDYSNLYSIAQKGNLSLNSDNINHLLQNGLVIRQDNILFPFSKRFGDFLKNSAHSNIEKNLIEMSKHPLNSTNSYDIEVWKIISKLEGELRKLVSTRAKQRWGETWEADLQSDINRREPDKVASWQRNREKDQRAFEGYDRSSTILDFTYLQELGQLINQEWDFFRNIFKLNKSSTKESKRILNEKIDQISPVRSALAHNREVPDTELRRAHVACEDLLKVTTEWNPS